MYRATHLDLNVSRALKIVTRQTPGVGSTQFSEFHQRFHLEAQLGASLHHSNLIQVHDFEQDGTNLILVMEYAPGGCLSERIAQAREEGKLISIEESTRIATDIAEGLGTLHAYDTVHRDLKPSNVLFDRDKRAKVADYGLAQLPSGPSMRSKLSEGQPHPGTPTYMSPEQINTFTHLTPASDVYALGLILFEMLTGRIYRNVRPGTRAGDLRQDLPEWLDDLLELSLIHI